MTSPDKLTMVQAHISHPETGAMLHTTDCDVPSKPFERGNGIKTTECTFTDLARDALGCFVGVARRLAAPVGTYAYEGDRIEPDQVQLSADYHWHPTE